MVDFLVIGPFGSVIYINIFPLIKDQKMRLGYARVNYFNEGNSCSSIWFTSFDVKERGYLKLKEYKEGDYKKFDKFDAINIDKSEDIPDGYMGLMGVPVTFLEKWNPIQFEIVDILRPRLKKRDTLLDGVYLYTKILIKRK